MTTPNDKQQIEFEAAAFRRLVEHLRERHDVQNIDLMNLAGFCRNCLSNWYGDAANEAGVALTKEQSRKSSTECPMRSGRKNIRRRRATPRKLPLSRTSQRNNPRSTETT